MEPANPKTSADRTHLPVVAGALAAVIASTSLVLGLDRLLGDRVRAGGLLLAETEAPTTAPEFNELTRGGAFFEDRDSIMVTVPRTMTVAEFLSLYHLENHTAVRASLAAELGATDWNDIIEEGSRVSFRLTRGRDPATTAPPESSR